MHLCANWFLCTVAGEATAGYSEEKKADPDIRWWARVEDEQDGQCRVRGYARYCFCRLCAILKRPHYLADILVSFLVLCVCSVFLEQPEKNGDGGEPKTTAAAVSVNSGILKVYCITLGSN